MAGLGRRSHYRKHLTDAVLHDLPEPDESLGQRIARVVGTRGGNMFDVVVAPPATSILTTTPIENDKSEKSASLNSGETPYLNSIPRTPQLAFLPTKFRKLVWIKRNDFVIVECGDEEDQEEQQQRLNTKDQSTSSSGGGFRYVITHILYKDQVKHIKSKGLWPLDPFFSDVDGASSSEAQQREALHGGDKNDDEHGSDECAGYNDEQSRADTRNDGGIVYDEPLGDEFMVNTNRIAAMRVDDSSSDESEED
ncbi:hypothetical protein HJC23_006354 [Cyclotella cryptica]|uniref:S1-like domain-containing protein n=1 Tax=Cyclotella cryptica TaxID=29204 RepID=A0ABD3Q479_9STRA|eukprot:CCRYP_008751-RA/>CCRYP_008751-RA protein AED:0.00 eAED:-0.00 QI:0/-1/0/1/-1/1/1/0/251